MESAVVLCEKVSLQFGALQILNNLSFSVKKGEKVALLGQSGSGKSSILNILLGFLPKFSGNITVFDENLNAENINSIRKKLAWLPQELTPEFDSVEAMFQASFHFSANRDLQYSEAKVLELFEVFDLPKDNLKKAFAELSGGQKQRILLISCLLFPNKLLLLDEPTSALDEKTKQKVADWIFAQNDLTIIAATHDENWIRKSDKVIEL